MLLILPLVDPAAVLPFTMPLYYGAEGVSDIGGVQCSSMDGLHRYYYSVPYHATVLYCTL